MSSGKLFCIYNNEETTVENGAGWTCVDPIDRAILANDRDALAAKYLKCRKNPKKCQ